MSNEIETVGHDVEYGQGEVSMDDLFAQTSAQLLAEHTDENTVRTGKYITKVRGIYEKVGDREYDEGRVYYNLGVSFFTEDDPTHKVGDGFISTSLVPGHTRAGKLDGASNRAAELLKVLPERPKSEAHFKQMVSAVVFMSRIREVYVVPEDELMPQHVDARVGDNGSAWITLDADDNEARAAYLGLGIEPRVQIDRIYPLKKTTLTPRRRDEGGGDDSIPF